MGKDFDADETSGWHQYQRLVLSELERLNDNFEKLSEQQLTQRLELENIKARAGFLGVISGALTALSFTIGKHIYDLFNR